jgi:hypothetical protein
MALFVFLGGLDKVQIKLERLPKSADRGMRIPPNWQREGLKKYGTWHSLSDKVYTKFDSCSHVAGV